MSKIETYILQTIMGNSVERLSFLSSEEYNNLNEIGYTGKLKGKETNIEDYLNTIGKGTFSVNQTKYDKGDYTEEFIITRVIEDNVIENSGVKYEYEIVDLYAPITRKKLNEFGEENWNLVSHCMVLGQYQYIFKKIL